VQALTPLNVLPSKSTDLVLLPQFLTQPFPTIGDTAFSLSCLLLFPATFSRIPAVRNAPFLDFWNFQTSSQVATWSAGQLSPLHAHIPIVHAARDVVFVAVPHIGKCKFHLLPDNSVPGTNS